MREPPCSLLRTAGPGCSRLSYTRGVLTQTSADMRMLCGLALAAMLLSGCAVYTPSGSVVVDPHDGGGRGGFCPPGQAKKGNC
ncbi:hypothetical protein D3C72_2313440 [compost metagenome]